MNEALNPPCPTRHRFLETREWLVPGPGGGQGWEFIFECCETGFEKRWGCALDPRFMTVDIDDEVETEVN